MVPESFDVTIPDGWESLSPTPGCVMILTEPAPPAGIFRTAVTLVLGEIPDGAALDLGTYAAARVGRLTSVLEDAAIIDQRAGEISGAEAVVTTIAYRYGDRALTLRQWAALAGDCGLLLGAVCANERLAGLLPQIDAIAGSLKLGGAASPTDFRCRVCPASTAEPLQNVPALRSSCDSSLTSDFRAR